MNRAIGLICVSFGSFLLACSSTGGSGSPLQGGGSTAGNGGGGGFGNFGNGGSGAIINVDGGGGGGNLPANCASGPNDDSDGDGYTFATGDCNDCDANANPGAYDVPGNGVDEDCNNTPDDTSASCDQLITDVATANPQDAARAMGLCNFTNPGEKAWGVLEAKYVRADGTPGINDVSHGMLTGFGPNVAPQEGTRLLALSSGTARQPSDPGYSSPGGFDSGTTGFAPAGFPKDSSACPGVSTSSDKTTYNPVGLELKIRVPTNAMSFKYLFNFYTFEFPVFVCDIYNDFFIALQNPAPPNAVDSNISFDTQGNPVSVNNGFLEVCSAQNAGGKNFPCALGSGQLQGTGFEDHAATGWLETVSPVTPGSEITLRFAIWDMGDEILDSTVLIDKFQFSAEEATGSSTTPVPR
ncbi:MAG: choice-of-anchor L domain-containing protein [Polyangiaceae bacterium]